MLQLNAHVDCCGRPSSNQASGATAEIHEIVRAIVLRDLACLEELRDLHTQCSCDRLGLDLSVGRRSGEQAPLRLGALRISPDEAPETSILRTRDRAKIRRQLLEVLAPDPDFVGRRGRPAQHIRRPSDDRAYIETHQYQPPQEFVDAAFACPAPGLAEYRDLLLEHLDCWSQFVPTDALRASLEDHLRHPPQEREYVVFDGEGALDGPWYVAIEGGVESRPVTIAKVFARHLGLSAKDARARVRSGDLGPLQVATAEDAAQLSKALKAAGAKAVVWNKPVR